MALNRTQQAARALGLGRLVQVIVDVKRQVANGQKSNNGKRKTVQWEFTAEELAAARNALKAGAVGHTRLPSRAKQRAAEYTQQLVAEGWEHSAAKARALAAYGLGPVVEAPEPTMSRAAKDEVMFERPVEQQPSWVYVEPAICPVPESTRGYVCACGAPKGWGSSKCASCAKPSLSAYRRRAAALFFVQTSGRNASR